ESGREYENDGTCARLALVTPECECGLALRQRLGFCGESPGVISLRYRADSQFAGARLRLERGPDDESTVVDELPMGLEREVVVDVHGVHAGIQTVRGW